jgi:hypothetical protein
VRYAKNPTVIRGHLSDIVSREIDAGNDVYEQFVRDMEREYEGTPMMYLRTPTYVFGENSPVTITELREKLAHILEGKIRARDYYDEVMLRVRAEGSPNSRSCRLRVLSAPPGQAVRG